MKDPNDTRDTGPRAGSPLWIFLTAVTILGFLALGVAMIRLTGIRLLIGQICPATTSAAITQCNGSAGGGTLVELTCAATGTMASALGVKINQCNNSANGGGALVICSASLISNAVNGTPPPAGTPAPSRTPPPTSTVGDRSSSDSMPLLPLIILFALAGLGLATVVVQRRSVRS